MHRPGFERLDRARLEEAGVAEPASPSDPAPLEAIACGRPLPRQEIRVVDATDHEVPDRHEGTLQFRGPSSTRGYHRNPEATARLFHGPWLDSGDRAYVADGEVFITGRAKDLIIRGGRNIHPGELDDVIGDIPGIRKGCVAAFGSRLRGDAERIILVAETREHDPETRSRLKEEVDRRCTDLLGTPPDEVKLVSPHAIPKTTSGKIRRGSTRELYERGLLDKTRPSWMQAPQLLAVFLSGRVRSGWDIAATFGYSAWAWTTLVSVAATTWTAVALLPRRPWRWGVVRGAARTFLWLARIPVRIRGAEHLPGEGPWVLVSNHTSYLDSLFLALAAPRDLCFVAKSELRDRFVPRIFLQRLGTLFVDRGDIEGSVGIPRSLVDAMAGGRVVALFPEGTLVRRPGVLPFHMSGFLAAAEAGVPVVPIAIRGVRAILRDESWLLRRGAAFLFVDAPIDPHGKDWSAAVRLRNEARASILRNTGEPDVAE